MPTYNRRFFMIVIIAVPLYLSIFSCSTLDNSIGMQTESQMVKLSKTAAPVKIMCLGNSLTYGENGREGGYRKPLYDRLLDVNLKHGIDFDFVGSRTDGGGKDFDKHHEGYPGYSTKRIIKEVLPNALNHKPDIILLHVGHNSVAEKDTEKWKKRADHLDELLNKIDEWENNNKPVHVIVAKIVQLRENNFKSKKSNNNNHKGLIEYNKEVEKLVNNRKNGKDRKGNNLKEKDKISLVDMSDVVSKGKDGCHSTQSGYRTMADFWYRELMRLPTGWKPIY